MTHTIWVHTIWSISYDPYNLVHVIWVHIIWYGLYDIDYIIPFDIIQIILLELQTVLSILIKEKMKRSNKGLTWIQFQFHRGLAHAFKGYFDLELECDYRIVRMGWYALSLWCALNFDLQWILGGESSATLERLKILFY